MERLKQKKAAEDEVRQEAGTDVVGSSVSPSLGVKLPSKKLERIKHCELCGPMNDALYAQEVATIRRLDG